MCAPTTTKKTSSSSSSSSSSSPPLRSLSSLSDESAAAAVVVINDSNNGKNNDNTKKEATSTSDNGGGIIDKIWPLHPSIVIVIMAIFVPSRCFLNRGFTIWFHWISILHLFTQFQSKFIEKFLILSGTSISLGWYSTLLWECIYHGRFFDALYNNVDVLYDYMPSFVMSSHPLIPITIIHVFDLLGHPLLTYYFWRRYNNINNNNNISNTTIPTPPNGDNDNNKNNESIHIVDEICTWPVLIAEYLFSRTWSIVHTYHNFGYFGLFYVGFDVYIIDSLDMWYPAYIAETILYSSLVLRKSLN